jgi:hypothetical protein
MANTLTNLIPNVYAALDVVSRELVGALPGVSRDAKADRLATGQTLRSHITPAQTSSTYTPSMAVPSAVDRVIGNADLTLSKNKYSAFSWTGEEEYAVDQGSGHLSIQQDQIAQAFRVLVNEMESDVCAALALGASRATGAAGTTPFASTLADSANVRKILDDNGAPLSARSLVINTSAGATLRTQSQLTKANEAGSAMTLRDGELLNLHGFSVRESAQIAAPAVGTSATAVAATGGIALGATDIVLKAAGTGTIVAGDVITFAGDTDNQYVVTVGAAAVSGATISIAAPGIRKAMTGEQAITIVATGPRNLAFSSNALLLATRLPVFPSQGDLAIDHEVVTDPRTGISFDLRVYPGDGMVLYRLHALWGMKVVKPEHCAILLG